MADDDFDPDDDLDPEPEDASKLRKTLATQGGQLKAAQRELAFRRAGIDIDSPLGKLFAKGYEGKLDDIDSIRAQFAEIAPAAPAAATPSAEQQPAPAEVEETPAPPSGSAERRALLEGAPPAGAPVGDFVENALEESKAYQKRGASAVAAGALLVNRMAGGLMSGEMAPTLNRDGTRIEPQ